MPENGSLGFTTRRLLGGLLCRQHGVSPSLHLSPGQPPPGLGAGPAADCAGSEGHWDTLPSRKPLISCNGRPGTGLWPYGGGFGHYSPPQGRQVPEPGRGLGKNGRPAPSPPPGPLRPVPSAPSPRPQGQGPPSSASLGSFLSFRCLRPGYDDEGPAVHPRRPRRPRLPSREGHVAFPRPGGGPGSPEPRGARRPGLSLGCRRAQRGWSPPPQDAARCRDTGTRDGELHARPSAAQPGRGFSRKLVGRLPLVRTSGTGERGDVEAEIAGRGCTFPWRRRASGRKERA